MDITLRSQDEFDGEALVFFVFEKDLEKTPGLQTWLAAQGGWLSGNSAMTAFSGKTKSARYFFPPSGTASPAVILVGLGGRKSFGQRELRRAVASAVGCAMDLRLNDIGLDTSVLSDTDLDIAQAVEVTTCAAMTAVYRFERLKTEKDESPTQPPKLRILRDDPRDDQADARLKTHLDRSLATGHGLNLARDLVNMPANLATPEYLAQTARDLAGRYGFGLEVMNADQIEALGMGAFAAVFQANRDQARLIILDSRPSPSGLPDQPTSSDGEKPLVVIGKGITFDTGGISLKLSQGMEEMKGDMGGAAAVLGFFEAHGRLGRSGGDQRRVVGIIPCTENLPGPKAVKPGDVVTTCSGKTVEIINTDAEGRLLLCDALAYSKRYDPLGIVDLATLTGAMVVSLGPRIAGAFAAPESLAEQVRRIGERVGEPVWPMPLWDDYKDELKSEVADLKNVGAREGGAIHAALFLHRFVPENTPWVHLDIAGPAYAKKKGDHGIAGGTGFGVRILMELTREWPETI
ncbi:leucyl aminopeptidase [Desulfonatronum thiodismutans]|uniref:leucyl aminopeptidase n=1 Tax=Desulfonatronum thiodismutans TaxID=159290 RepID=UPI0004ABEB30|nr:leucyl aminopeptidase [Desulfonatronum thiodismutans]